MGHSCLENKDVNDRIIGPFVAQLVRETKFLGSFLNLIA